MQTYTIYILLCENQSLYTGITTNLEKRYQQHCDGTAAKYTRSFKPVSIAKYWIIGSDRGHAQKIEYQIKQLSREKKRYLIDHINDTNQLIACLSNTKFTDN